jgi:hypothetical protein
VQLPRQANDESFWQVVETLLNDSFMELFMSPASKCSNDGDSPQFSYIIGLDDDKLHYNHNSKTPADGLKKGHHAKDNRRGFTAHTACHSATAAPLNVSFQRQHETVHTTVERMLAYLFGKHTGQTGRLGFLELAMDRGYWEAVLLFLLLDKGANVHGTIMRQPWVPFTFVKGNTIASDNSQNDFPNTPYLISNIGFKDSFHMETMWTGGKKTAFRKLACIGC